MIYKLNLRTGLLNKKAWQGFAADIYAAAVDNDVIKMGEVFDSLMLLQPDARFDLLPKDSTTAILSSGGKIVGEEIVLTLSIDLTPAEITFNLNRYATTPNDFVIGHLLDIGGKLRLYRPFDPRILKFCGNDIKKVSGVDITTYQDKGKTLGFKPFLSLSMTCEIQSLEVPGEDFVPFTDTQTGYWLALRLIIDKHQRKNPDYSMADLVRVAVGDAPRDFEVDSTAP